jgi:hypothetical protein
MIPSIKLTVATQVVFFKKVDAYAHFEFNLYHICMLSVGHSNMAENFGIIRILPKVYEKYNHLINQIMSLIYPIILSTGFIWSP